jgi:hypothetical protein
MNSLDYALKLCPEWIALLEENTQTGVVKLSLEMLIDNTKKDDPPLMVDLLHSWRLMIERRKIKALIKLLRNFHHRHTN